MGKNPAAESPPVKHRLNKGGRLPIKEEVWRYLGKLNLPEYVTLIIQAAERGEDVGDIKLTTAEMLDEFIETIYKRKDKLGDSALAQSLNSLAKLVEIEERNKPPEPTSREDEPLIADVLEGIANLPLDQEILMLQSEQKLLEREQRAIERRLGKLAA